MKEIVDRVAAGTGLPRREVDKAVRAAFAAIVESLARGESVRIWGFGRFSVVNSRDRGAWDFRKRQVMRGLVRRSVRFRAGTSVMRAVKEGRE